MMGAGETNNMESHTKEDNPVVTNTDKEMDDVEEGMETNVEEKLKSE